MGVLSRGLLVHFLNIPCVRRHFHNFLFNEERQIWLNRWNRSGFIANGKGLSMYPTFTGDRGELVFISHLTHLKNGVLRVGDVVSLSEPRMFDKAWAQKHPTSNPIVKRIAGHQGYRGYMKGAWKGAPTTKVIVPPGYCWVLGDNSLVSRDSRRFGPVPSVSIAGKVIWRLTPEAFNFINHDPDYGATKPPQNPTSTTRQPIRPDADQKTPAPEVKVILKTRPTTITGPRPHLRNGVSDTKRQEPIGRSSSKRF